MKKILVTYHMRKTNTEEVETCIELALDTFIADQLINRFTEGMGYGTLETIIDNLAYLQGGLTGGKIVDIREA